MLACCCNVLHDGGHVGLGGCAIGTVNIDLFAKMTAIEFHIEGPVGQFVIGRPSDTRLANSPA